MTDAELSSTLSPTTDFVGDNIDVLEEDIHALSPFLLRILLQDKSTGHFIRWGCDNYKKFGEEYTAEKEIFPRLIIGRNTTIIQPRTAKSKDEQKNRTRESAEVFTPSWICNEMNNQCDEEYFGRPNVFNVPKDKGWTAVPTPIEFKNNRNKNLTEWQKYIDSRRLEITCGEAPYLVSRYDTTTGQFLPLEQRIGLLDRKLRIVHENTTHKAEWFKWARRAFESIYGYEFQGDNLLLARENLLLTFIDYYKFKFNSAPELPQLKTIANIIAWNIWQMDGLTDTVPYSVVEQSSEVDLFEKTDHAPEKHKDQQCRKNPVVDLFNATPVLCQIKNWRSEVTIFFKDLKGDKTMKFDFCIGNPPYQDNTNDNNRQSPIYNLFMEEAFKISPVVEFITPARFLFNAGQTPRWWNRKMLSDEHYKVLSYEQDGTKVFPGHDIKGGIVISIRNLNKNYGTIGTFIANKKLNVIMEKVNPDVEHSICSISYPKSNYKFSRNLYVDFPMLRERLTEGNEYIIDADIFNKIPEIFVETSGVDFIEVCGRENNARIRKYVKSRYIENSDNLNKYKIFVAGANGSGTFGEVLSNPFVAHPKCIHTQTYMSIGCFETEFEANSCLKYLKTKFARCLLGVLKVTQNNPRDTWAKIPLQDFTENSDIDWSKSISEIDQQLYKKYDLSEEEIAFIEQHIKPME